MKIPEPQFCRPEAFNHFAAQLPHLDTTEGLLYAAIAISEHELDGVQAQEIDGRLWKLAEQVHTRVKGLSDQARLAHLHEILFEEQIFRGNADDFYNPLNSYLPAILDTKLGIPITLALLYKVVGERVGLKVTGINAPGHFLARVELDGDAMLVDPFHGGRVLTPLEAVTLIRTTVDVELHAPSQLLPAAAPRQWLARMLANLQAIFLRSERTDDLGAMSELAAML